MAITYVGAGATVTGTVPLDVPFPSGLISGDLLVLVLSNQGAPPTAPLNPLPWTRIFTNAAAFPGLAVYVRQYNGNETTTTIGNAIQSRAVMLAYRGIVNFETVVTVATAVGTSATTPVTTTTVANDLVLSIYNTSYTGTTCSFTADPATTERVNVATTTSNNGILIADEIQASIGATTPRTATLSASNTWRAISIAFREVQNTYYWVGGAGSWNTSSTTNWALTSGGAGGAGVPTIRDNAVFDNNSSSGVAFEVTTSSAVCNDLIFGTGASALTQTLALNCSSNLSISGNFYLPTSNINPISTKGNIILNPPYTGKIIDAPPVTQLALNLNSTTGSGVCLRNNWNGSGFQFTMTGGYIEINGYSLNIGTFSTTTTFARGLNAGAGSNINVSGLGTIWTVSSATGLTNVWASTASINITGTGTSNRTFQLRGTYGTINNALTSPTAFLIFDGPGIAGVVKNTGTLGRRIGFQRTVDATVNAFDISSGPSNICYISGSSNQFATTVIYNGPRVNFDYVDISYVVFSYTLDALNPYRIYAGPNSTTSGNIVGVAMIDGTQFTAYKLTTSSNLTIPSNWNSSNNTIYLFGGGGTGGNGRSSGTNRAAGGGGGGGGLTVVTNFSATVGQVIPFVVGSGGTGGTESNGGNTTWNSGAFVAGGGGTGSSNATIPSSIAGVGGTGTIAGGNGGLGFVSTASFGAGGGGGGGAAGPLGVGRNGGNGNGTSTIGYGGGGGGCSGGTNGGNATTTSGGLGGNNNVGVGGGTSTTNAGYYGGGGFGGQGSTFSGAGSYATLIERSFGSGGGSGGSGSTGGVAGVTVSSTNSIGAGGGGVSSAGVGLNGGFSNQGVIYIIYGFSSAPSVSNGNFFFMLT